MAEPSLIVSRPTSPATLARGCLGTVGTVECKYGRQALTWGAKAQYSCIVNSVISSHPLLSQLFDVRPVVSAVSQRPEYPGDLGSSPRAISFAFLSIVLDSCGSGWIKVMHPGCDGSCSCVPTILAADILGCVCKMCNPSYTFDLIID